MGKVMNNTAHTAKKSKKLLKDSELVDLYVTRGKYND